MVDGDSDDGSVYDESTLYTNSQESSELLTPLLFRSIWDCPGMMLNQIKDGDKIIPGWRCGYCLIRGGVGPPPFFKYCNATKALSHLSSKGEDIICCKGLRNIPSNVCNSITALKHYKNNKKMTASLARIP